MNLKSHKYWPRRCALYLRGKILSKFGSTFTKTSSSWFNYYTRKHSSRMRTSHLEAVHASVLVVTTKCHSWGGTTWTSLNRSPVITTRCHYQGDAWTDLSLRGGTLPDLSWGEAVPCHMTYPMMHLMFHTPLPHRQTDIHLWKYYHSPTLFGGGKNKVNSNYRKLSLRTIKPPIKGSFLSNRGQYQVYPFIIFMVTLLGHRW